MPTKTTQDRLDFLKEVGTEIISDPTLKPVGDKTFCNFAVCAVASDFGYKSFLDSKGEPLMADQIISVMARDTANFKLLANQDAFNAVMNGNLVIACYSEAPHGHVAVLAPVPRVWSGKWSDYTPCVYNVGRTVGLMGCNFAFALRPNFYVYLSELPSPDKPANS